MKTEWDYSSLAQAYLQRPDYAPSVIEWIVTQVGPGPLDICDVGAGVAHLTIPFARRGHRVCAVEPNDEMRKLGVERTREFKNVTWSEGVGEKTGQPAASFDLVSFGSSFNVTDRALALKETARLLRPRGWFFCVWNHRDLTDPLQAEIEKTIASMVPSYSYGTRREDQRAVIDASKLFAPALQCEGAIVASQSRADIVEAWRSHATLQRQAGASFLQVVGAIEAVLTRRGGDRFEVPYTSRAWAAQRG